MFHRASLMATVWLCLSVSAQGSDAIRQFEIRAIDDSMIRVSDYKGQWLAVNFWATWCKPCRKELPELQELHHADNSIVLIGLAFEDEPPEVIAEFLSQYNVEYPVAIVGVYEPPEIFGYPSVLPTTVLVNPEGDLVKTWYGEITAAQVTDFVASQTTQGQPAESP